jgi:hypothetical protein
MYRPFKRTLSPADRALFEKWLRGIAVLYGIITLLAVCAIAIGQTVGGHARSDVAAISTSPSTLPP